MRPQPMIAVSDVEASSRWYQAVLGATSGHGGNEYEQLHIGGETVLQLHTFEDDHHHEPIGNPDDKPYGNGVLLWLETEAFDTAVDRAVALGTDVVRAPHVNPNAHHRELWVRDPDGYMVVLASPFGDTGDTSDTTSA